MITKKITRYELSEKDTINIFGPLMPTTGGRVIYAKIRDGGLIVEIETEREGVE